MIFLNSKLFVIAYVRLCSLDSFKNWQLLSSRKLLTQWTKELYMSETITISTLLIVLQKSGSVNAVLPLELLYRAHTY